MAKEQAGGGGRRPTGRAARSPVTLRLGDLEDEVAARVDARLTPGAVVKRDLARYYRLLRDGVGPTSFTPPEALALTLLLRDVDSGAYRYLWAHVDEALAIPHLESVDPFFASVSREELVRKLRTLPIVCMGVLDAVERFWRRVAASGVPLFPRDAAIDPEFPVTEPVLAILCDVGLVDPFLEARVYRRRRDAKRSEPPPAPDDVPLTPPE